MIKKRSYLFGTDWAADVDDLIQVPELSFWINCIPPKATAQMQKTAVINGHVRKYDPKNVKQAKSDLFSMLHPRSPEKPIEGPVRLSVVWAYPWRKSEPKKNRVNGWRPCDTRPDCSNLTKALEDTMTRCGYWNDDSQVAALSFEKKWSDTPGIGITVERMT